jgi:Glycosyl transferase family 2
VGRREHSGKSGSEAEVEELTRRVGDLEAFADEAVTAVAAQQRALEGLDARIANLERAQEIWSTMTYVRDAVVDKKPLVSVVLATRNRSAYLPHAVASVLAQTYPTWELLAVDDGSNDETPGILDAFDDERIRCFRRPHGGLSAARNHALSETSGDYIAYIDDDNTMHPDWLRSVVWAFTSWPQIDLLYGAMIIEATPPDEPMPWLRFVPYDRTQLEQSNPTDMGAVAHRAGLPEAVFDEELPSLEDWDLLLRVARTRDILAFPVVAGTYGTTAPDRLSSASIRDPAVRQLRRKHANVARAAERAAD